jgi:hypothetical protein
MNILVPIRPKCKVQWNINNHGPVMQKAPGVGREAPRSGAALVPFIILL